MRDFSRRIREEASLIAKRCQDNFAAMRFAFVGNMANTMYSTACAMRHTGVQIKVFPHPTDDYIMSQPEWEEFDGSLDIPVHTLSGALGAGLTFPALANVERVPELFSEWGDFIKMPPFVSKRDHDRYAQFYAFAPLYRRLQNFDALFATQAPYLARLAERPYMLTHTGGEIWYECSRGDQLGVLQRDSFARAGLVIASNPWSYSFARRYGFINFAHIPTLLDPEFYSPGEPDLRDEWRCRSGGDFFILSTARLDNFYKGSDIALQAVARFLRASPSARLVQIAWGKDVAEHLSQLQKSGIASQVLFVPPVGKRRLVRYLRSAHLLVDQFTLGYYGMTALEAIACGLPVVMKLNHSQYYSFLEAGVPPVCNASDEDGIVSHLSALFHSPSYRAKLARSSREWFINYSGANSWSDCYRDMLIALASGHKFDFKDSPLTRPLTAEEIEYHNRELQQAPAFPNYI